MLPTLHGIHHVTAICGDPQTNLDFYAGFLGLRLVKRTINFDDPGTYHLYYGNATGQPGTLMTFFPWIGVRPGRTGTGQVAATSFAVPQHSVTFWQERARQFHVENITSSTRFGETVLSFKDPDGLPLELTATLLEEQGQTTLHDAIWSALVPMEHAIRHIHAVTLQEEGYERTARLLTEVMGCRLAQEEGNRFRYAMGAGGSSAWVDVICTPDARHGLNGGGTVHHVAWRTPDDEQQKAWRQRLASNGQDVSPVMDRDYFHSIYYREPGGVLFEIATDPPGFGINEPLERLGERLMLPPWLEEERSALEGALPRLTLPYAGGEAGL